DRQPHAVDVRANGESEQHDLHDRQRDEHDQGTEIAKDVKHLFLQQPLERTHAGVSDCGRASRTNNSSIESTPNCRFRSAGAPIAAIRPLTMIEMRSQYSASSM